MEPPEPAPSAVVDDPADAWREFRPAPPEPSEEAPAPDEPDAPEIAEVSEGPEADGTPGLADTAKHPEVAEAPDADVVAEAPETAETPDAPATPGTPDVAEGPSAPGAPPSPGSGPPPAPPVPQTFSGAELDLVLDAIRDGFAGISVGIDLTLIEQAMRRALDTDRRGMVEPLARRLAIVLSEAIDIPDAQEVAEAVGPYLPRPDDIADVVSARIADLLSETVLRRSQSETSAVPMVAGMMAAVERFEVQLDGLHDQLRRATGILGTFGERLQVADRRAAVAERTNAFLEQEIKRLVRRVEEQVENMATPAARDGDPDLADGVVRLTRKLRENVTQLDRALVRLDLLLDSEDAPLAPGFDDDAGELVEPADTNDSDDYDVPR